MTEPRFADAFATADAYKAPAPTPATLDLASNTGVGPSAAFCARVSRSAGPTSSYPHAGSLRNQLAENLGLAPDRLCVTAGGDDAIDRICRIALQPGRRLVTTTPTFEMIARSAVRTGAVVDEIVWRDEFPVDEIIAAVGPDTGLIAIVSPNNPTGCVAPTADLVRIASTNPETVFLVDLAYVEYADEDPTAQLLKFDNVVVVRTLSKAWGLAGLRIGFACGTPAIVARVYAAGGPYCVARPSLAIASAWLDEGRELVEETVERVREQRGELATALSTAGFEAFASGANFVCVRGATELATRLADAGIRVRFWADSSDRSGLVRITVPGTELSFARLISVIEGAALPDKCEVVGTRMASMERCTAETRIAATLEIDGSGASDISTGLGFLDHMLTALAKHSRIDLEMECVGDLDVDDHHSVEDCAIVLGNLLREALGDRAGVRRFADALVPLDEALARAVVDLSGRPSPRIALGLSREMLGDTATENLTHFLETLATEGRFALHVDVLEGENDHHRAEAAFKAVAKALREAMSMDGFGDVPSTKGVLG